MRRTVRRAQENLAQAEHRVGCERVARLVRAAGLRGVSKTGMAPRAMRAVPETQQAPELWRDFAATAPDQLWGADIT